MISFRGGYKWGYLTFFLLLIPAISYSQDTLKAKYGWIQFKSNVDSLYVLLDNNFSTYMPIANGDSLRLKAGGYHFTFVNRNYWDEKMILQVLAQRHLQIFVPFHHKIRRDFNRSSYKRITEGMSYNLTLKTDPNSTIIIDDSTYGKHYIKTDVGPYYHTILIKHPTAKDRKEKIYIEPSEQVNLSLYDRPSRTAAYFYGLIPGASQLYKNQKLKGALFITASTCAIVLSLDMAQAFKKNRRDYNYLHSVYEGDINEKSAYNDGLAAQHKYESMKTASRIRDLAITTAVSIYVANILDAFLSVPKSGYRIGMGISPGYVNNRTSLNLNMKVSF